MLLKRVNSTTFTDLLNVRLKKNLNKTSINNDFELKKKKKKKSRIHIELYYNILLFSKKIIECIYILYLIFKIICIFYEGVIKITDLYI